MLRTPEEIMRVLNSLLTRAEPITADIKGGKLLFRSRLRYIDPARAYIIIEPSADKSANQAMLERSRVTFHAEPGGWCLEFVAADPKPAGAQESAAGIRMRFPEIMAGHRRREHDRAEAPQQQELRCVIDEDGVMSFDGTMSNVSKGGIGFLQYDPTISLEPGTMLRGCRIDSPSGSSVVVNLEVRYSQLVTLADGRQAQSSGCRFVNLSAEETLQVEQLFGLKP